MSKIEGIVLLQGALEGLLLGLLISIGAFLKVYFQHRKSNKRLKECLVEENTDDISLFEHEGKKYDRKKFIRLEVQYLYEEDVSKEELEKELKELESNLENSKTPGLDEAKIKARHILIEKM